MILPPVNKDDASYTARQSATVVTASHRPLVLMPRSSVHMAANHYELEEPDVSRT